MTHKVYCIKCKTLSNTRNHNCSCCPSLLRDTLQLVRMYHKNTNSATETVRILKENGYQYSANTISEIIRETKGMHTPITKREADKLKRETFFNTKKPQESGLKEEDLPFIEANLKVYLKQKNNPKFPLPKDYVMVAPNIIRYKDTLERMFNISLP